MNEHQSKEKRLHKLSVSLDLTFLYSYRVTHRVGNLRPFDRWHWTLTTDYDLSFCGDGPEGRGWKTAATAKAAGLKAMRNFLKEISYAARS